MLHRLKPRRPPRPWLLWAGAGGAGLLALLLVIVLATMGGRDPGPVASGKVEPAPTESVPIKSAPVALPGRPEANPVAEPAPADPPQLIATPDVTPADWVKYRDTPLRLPATPTRYGRAGGGQYQLLTLGGRRVALLDLQKPGSVRTLPTPNGGANILAGNRTSLFIAPGQPHVVRRYNLESLTLEAEAVAPMRLSGLGLGHDSTGVGVARVAGELLPFDPDTLKFGPAAKTGQTSFGTGPILGDAAGTRFGIPSSGATPAYIVVPGDKGLQVRGVDTTQGYLAPALGSSKSVFTTAQKPRPDADSPAVPGVADESYLPALGEGFLRVKLPRAGARGGVVTGFDAGGREVGSARLPADLRLDGPFMLPHVLSFLPGPRIVVALAGDKVYGLPLTTGGTAEP